VAAWNEVVPPSSDLIQAAFASGGAEVNRALVERMAAARPDVPLVVVAEFEPAQGEWIPWHVKRSYESNLAALRAALGSRKIVSVGMILASGIPHHDLRRAARQLAPQCLTTFDEHLREVSAGAYRLRRIANALTSPRARKWLRRIVHPGEAELPIRARLAQAVGKRQRPAATEAPIRVTEVLPEGVTVVIPSRDGRDLLGTLLPGLEPAADLEIIVSDNGSTDGTARWLAEHHPHIRVIETVKPLSFARAVNLGIAAARFRHTLLLNNDMVLEPGFVEALRAAFREVPDLFCSTAQIFFPPGVRREETGKAVWRQENPLDFPVRCDDPIPGEDLTWVLYGSGGCSLFDTAKLRALGGVSEIYDPAYVEDLDFGYRAWKQGWPTVFCANAGVEHRHRATTARFFTPRQLGTFVEINYLRFLVHAVGSPDLFRRLWREAIRRLQLNNSLDALRALPKPGPMPAPAAGPLSETEILALGNGDIAIFRGQVEKTKPMVVLASPYLPFPLSHGGAVRMYNLMRRTASGWAQILVAFCDQLAPPPAELLAICHQVILVRRHGTHYRKESPRPDTVEEFDSETFRACLKQTVHQWKPAAVQLEFTWMAQYASACASARTILVEHDITFDLQEQLLATRPDNWELRQQLEKWRAFETAAWREVDCVVTMSEKDAARVTGAKEVVCLPNGVDTERFQPVENEPDPHRLLFIGSFAHLPNLLALEFFLRDVWPLLGPGYTLHVIAGSRPEYYLDFHRGRVTVDLTQPGIELEAFVSDVRGAYARAGLVLAPLTASAGTNIKVLEAMAMGRVVVSTPAGINGLDLSAGTDVIVTPTAVEMAHQIRQLSSDPRRRKQIEQAARETALRFDWRQIATAQSHLYSVTNQAPARLRD